MDTGTPPAAFWGLAEAIRCTADPLWMAHLHRDLLAAAERGVEHEPIQWWHWADPPLPPPAPRSPQPPIFVEHDGRRWLYTVGIIETEFRHRLVAGQLRAWGRPGSVLAAPVRIPWGIDTQIVSLVEGGGTVRVCAGKLLYHVRVEQTAAAAGTLPLPGTMPATTENIERWYREYVGRASRTSDQADADAATAYFGEVIPRTKFRPIRTRVLRELRPDLVDAQGNLKPGRRSI